MSAATLAEGAILKRPRPESDKTTGEDEGEVYEREVKKRRLEIYSGSLDIKSFEKATFILGFGEWIASRHGLTYFHHPLTGLRTFVPLPSHLVPYDALPVLYGHVKGLPLLDLTPSPPSDGREEGDDLERSMWRDAIGTQSQAIYIGLMASLASLLSVMDHRLSLHCQYCNLDASDCFLLTLAEEYRTECRHHNVLSAGADVAWADEAFSSRLAKPDTSTSVKNASPGKTASTAEGERVGMAVCLECLYGKIMQRDEKLMDDIGLFQSLLSAYFRNREWEADSETLAQHSLPPRRLCGCRHPNGAGVLCLFRFSRLLAPTHRAIHEEITRGVVFPALIESLAATSQGGGYGQQKFDSGTGASYHYPLIDPDVERHLTSCTPFYKLVLEIRARHASTSAMTSPSRPFIQAHEDAAAAAAKIGASQTPAAPASPPRLSSTGVGPLPATARRLDFDSGSSLPVSPPRRGATAPGPVSTIVSPDSATLLGLVPTRFASRPPSADELTTLTTREHVDFLQSALPWVEAFYQSADRVGSQMQLPFPGGGGGISQSTSVTAPDGVGRSGGEDEEEPTDLTASSRGTSAAPPPRKLKKRRPTAAPGDGGGRRRTSLGSTVASSSTIPPPVGFTGLYIGQQHAPQSMPDYCRVCGCYGHSQIKTCPFVMSEKVKARANTTLGDHYAQNVPPFSLKARSALGDFVALAIPQARQLSNAAALALARQAWGVGMPRGGPSPESLETMSTMGKDTLTPSIEFATLVSISLESYASMLHLDFFWDDHHMRSIILHWRSQGFAVADLEDLLDWLEEMKQGMHDRAPFSQLQPPERQGEIRRSLFAFVQDRQALVLRAGRHGDEDRLFEQVMQERRASVEGRAAVARAEEPFSEPRPLPAGDELPLLDFSFSPFRLPPPGSSEDGAGRGLFHTQADS
jgi:DNA-binding transcriptional MerR regulator